MQKDKAESWLQEYTKEEQVAIITMLVHPHTTPEMLAIKNVFRDIYVFQAMIEATMASYVNGMKELKYRIRELEEKTNK